MTETTMVALGVNYGPGGERSVTAVSAKVTSTPCFQRKLERALCAQTPHARAASLPRPTAACGVPDGPSLEQLMQQLRAWLEQLSTASSQHASGPQWGQQPTRHHSAAAAGLVEAAGHRSNPSDALVTSTKPSPGPGSAGAPGAAPPPARASTATPATSVTLGSTGTATFLVQQQGVHASVAMRDPNFLVASSHDRDTDAPIEVGARLETGMRKIADMLRQLGEYMLSGKVPTRDELDAAAAESNAIFQEATRLRTGDADVGDFTASQRDGVLQLGAIPPSTASIAVLAATQPTDTHAPAGSPAPPTDEPPGRGATAETTVADPVAA